MPAGVISVVNGAANVGDVMARHHDIDTLTFVGSTATGELLMKAAGESNVKRLNLECGGKSPYIVFDDCEEYLDFAASDVVATAFRNQGEICIAGSRVLIQESLREKIIPKLIDHAKAITPSDMLGNDCSFGPLMNEANLNKVLSYIDSGKSPGSNLVMWWQQAK